MNFVKPYFVRANHFIKSISGVFSYSVVEKKNPKEFLRTKDKVDDDKKEILIVGYMEHDPKKYAFRKHSFSF
jgi:hypothetical protein